MALLTKPLLASVNKFSNANEKPAGAVDSPNGGAIALTPARLILLVSCYFFLVLNVALLVKLFGILEGLSDVNLGFVLSIPLFFIAAFNGIFSLLTVFRCEKWLLVPLIIISSLLSYAMYNYGTIVDRDMLVNVMQTHSGEAKSYFTLSALLWFVFTGLLPAVLIVKLPIRRSTIWRELAMKLVSIAISLLVILAIAALYYKDYASVGRNNHYLNKMIIPTHFSHSLYGYLKSTYFTLPKPYQMLGEDATLTAKSSSGRKQVMVLMVGETARAANFQHGGYERDTNAFTKPLGITYFQDVSSCGTATAISVPCMFSRQSRQEFSGSDADNQDNLMDIIHRAGINTVWLENDGGCKGVCARIQTVEFKPDANNPVCDGDYCQDQVLLEGLQEQLNKLDAQQSVIVLHMVGSHGPTYYKRYPQAFAHFQPDCQRSDIQNCDARQLNNTYDNTLYYSDYIIAQVIEQLRQHEDLDTGLLYVSDHGESLGESGMYLHGMPYALATTEQTHVPMLTWFSDTFTADKQLDENCLTRLAQQEGYSHDNLFDSMLGLLDVSTQVYRPQLDIFNVCRQDKALSSISLAAK
ncbi:phosphoethanolamine transferase [Shewanella algidipiscicola]|uniref:Phosphoethanolamine transferase n=1 Tax=Shewanella algidipiscicola TaxID=614070 RepID=A0ABQ4NT40_9GAMM|nr:phosphoethanolamine--lipid A transferase [Shewanella algidipiscicola]GIU02614.1 phosphoethanolamine transferase [Shewanella algidipiscicola]